MSYLWKATTIKPEAAEDYLNQMEEDGWDVFDLFLTGPNGWLLAVHRREKTDDRL